MDYKNKYLKYKNKYLNLKKLIGGMALPLSPEVLRSSGIRDLPNFELEYEVNPARRLDFGISNTTAVEERERLLKRLEEENRNATNHRIVINNLETLSSDNKKDAIILSSIIDSRIAILNNRLNNRTDEENIIEGFLRQVNSDLTEYGFENLGYNEFRDKVYVNL